MIPVLAGRVMLFQDANLGKNLERRKYDRVSNHRGSDSIDRDRLPRSEDVRSERNTKRAPQLGNVDRRSIAR